MTPEPDSTPPAAVQSHPAVQLAAAGFKDLADRAELLLDQLRQLGVGQETVARLDRLIFCAKVGQQDAENTLAAIAARSREPADTAAG